MDGRARRFRERAREENRGKRGTGIRYSPGLRSEAVVYARDECARGVPRAAVARALGVPDHTLSIWLRSTPRARFRRVEMSGAGNRAVAAPVRVLVFTTRQGDRVEGLDVADLATLLRALL